MSRSLRAAALLAVTVVLLPALAHGQILTKDGDPVATVTDAAKAVPAGKTQGKAPALKAGQRVLLLVEKDGMALVCAEAPGPGAGIFDEYRYRLPLAAVAFLPGKTHRGRPAWLPVPGPAEAARRDVVAYEQGDAIFVRSGEGPPKRVAKGTRPALSPDGARLAYTPEKGAGLMLVSLDGDARPMRIGDGKEPVRQKAFCPDGSKLAWLVDRHVEVLDLARPGAAPTTAASGLEPGAALQGFAKACDALVLRNGDTVQWVEIAGKTLPARSRTARKGRVRTGTSRARPKRICSSSPAPRAVRTPTTAGPTTPPARSICMMRPRARTIASHLGISRPSRRRGARTENASIFPPCPTRRRTARTTSTGSTPTARAQPTSGRASPRAWARGRRNNAG
jgi:hypothetical protein